MDEKSESADAEPSGEILELRAQLEEARKQEAELRRQLAAAEEALSVAKTEQSNAEVREAENRAASLAREAAAAKSNEELRAQLRVVYALMDDVVSQEMAGRGRSLGGTPTGAGGESSPG